MLQLRKVFSPTRTHNSEHSTELPDVLSDMYDVPVVQARQIHPTKSSSSAAGSPLTVKPVSVTEFLLRPASSGC